MSDKWRLLNVAEKIRRRRLRNQQQQSEAKGDELSSLSSAGATRINTSISNDNVQVGLLPLINKQQYLKLRPFLLNNLCSQRLRYVLIGLLITLFVSLLLVNHFILDLGNHIQIQPYNKIRFQEEDRAWCILNTTNACHWGTIAHTLQVLFPCWSHFNQYRLVQQNLNHPNNNNKNVKCSILLSHDPLLKKRTLTVKKSLGYKVMQAMDCSLVVGDESMLQQYNVLDSSRIYYHEIEDGVDKNVTWFFNTEDAHDIRDRFLALYGRGITVSASINSSRPHQSINDRISAISDNNSNNIRSNSTNITIPEPLNRNKSKIRNGNNKKDSKAVSLQVSSSSSSSPPPTTRLRIGLLNRKKDRAILNMDEIKSDLHELFPAADIDSTYFENTKHGYQAQWFATKDVIFAPHGAAITWSAFIQSNTIVIQAYPPNYYPNKYFEPLIQIAGGYAYDWHLGDTPFLDHKKNDKRRAFWRKQSFSVPVQEAMDIFIKATKAHKSCESKKCA